MPTHVTVTENGLDEESLAELRSMKTSELIMMLDEDVLIATFAPNVLERGASAEKRHRLVAHLVEAIAAEVDRRIPIPA
jgi:hypothetical protein